MRLWNPDTSQPLKGHTGDVLNVAFSIDGHKLATAGDADGTVRLWNPDTGQPLSPPLAGHTGIVWTVAFSHDGHKLASSKASTARAAVEPRHRPTNRRPLTGQTGIVWTVVFSHDGHEAGQP